MGNTLKDLVSKLNTAQEKTLDPENPVNQIVKILNAHLTSLQWIDQNAGNLQSKIQDVTKQMSYQKSEQDRLYGRRRDM